MISNTPGSSPFHGFACGCLPPNCATPIPIASSRDYSCSSIFAHRPVCASAARAPSRRCVVAVDPVAVAAVHDGAPPGLVGEVPCEGPAPAVLEGDGRGLAGCEIGRAACRERGGEYV